MTIWHETARIPPRHRTARKCMNRRSVVSISHKSRFASTYRDLFKSEGCLFGLVGFDALGFLEGFVLCLNRLRHLDRSAVKQLLNGKNLYSRELCRSVRR